MRLYYCWPQKKDIFHKDYDVGFLQTHRKVDKVLWDVDQDVVRVKNAWGGELSCSYRLFELYVTPTCVDGAGADTSGAKATSTHVAREGVIQAGKLGFWAFMSYFCKE